MWDVNHTESLLVGCGMSTQLVPLGKRKAMLMFAMKQEDSYQRWSPRGDILKSLALASRPQVLENRPVLGLRTALFFELLKFCGALEKLFGKRFLWRSLEKVF